jgi:hypothetical protein
MTTLLIDDEKDPQIDPLLKQLGTVDRIARNFAQGILALSEQHWTRLLLDHDLADFSGPGGSELTGRSVILWLAQPENRQHIPGEIVCVSRNVVGIKDLLQDIAALYDDPDRLLPPLFE